MLTMVILMITVIFFWESPLLQQIDIKLLEIKSKFHFFLVTYGNIHVVI